jgi:hypothetical protein
MWEDLAAAGMLKDAWEPPPDNGAEDEPPDTAGQPFSKPARNKEMVGDRVRASGCVCAHVNGFCQ